MKLAVGMLSLLVIAGCASSPIPQDLVSSAKVKVRSIDEIGSPSRKRHVVNIEFDYVITNYQNDEFMYRCAVHFLAVDGTSITSVSGEPLCKIDSQSGRSSVRWRTPFDDASPLHWKEVMTEIKYPLEMTVAILQYKRHWEPYMIGKSEFRKLTVRR
ncbi:hypothetical protein ACXYTJ_08145 [Gilvimarinus sp. F26214L]|uniref:hypothetical protein n=1 Tax=Gilvimarinus sp. DZF01 TaxID=3461371 RepID=UPI00404654FC